MSHSVVLLLRHDPMKVLRWAILILPIFSCGCFEQQSATQQLGKKKEAGIASISRFFSFGQDEAPEKEVAKASTGPAIDDRSDITAGYEIEAEAFENAIETPAFVGAGKATAGVSHGIGSGAGNLTGVNRNEQASGFRNAASLVFNTPFNLLFANVFKQTKSEEIVQSMKDDLLNPFTEAIQEKEESAKKEDSDVKAMIAEKNDDSEEQTDTEETKSALENSQSSNPATSTGSGISSSSCLIVGNIDGSGTLQALSAQRSTDTVFISADGGREFNLFINSDSVVRQRSFYIDDVDMDGISDILASGASALFGSVYLGTGDGGFRYADKFVTGYDPALVSTGPLRNGMREILAVSARTGVYRTFHYTDKYRILQNGKLDFPPDYLLHLITPDTSLDYVMAAKTGGAEQISAWKDDGQIQPTADQLGADALVLNRDMGAYSLRGYQVGDFASIVLTHQDISFNVANMRLEPGTFVVIGDLKRKGTLDVAVARLESFNPVK